jgi:hypothetical protein
VAENVASDAVIIPFATAEGNDFGSLCLYDCFGSPGWVVASVFSADMLRPGFVCWLFLPFLVLHEALLRRASIRLRHASLSTMLAAHILSAFQITCF